MMMIKKAFTLAEVFIAMVILSVLVSVSVTFFSSKKDYEREYFYYSAYLNLVKVVDAALLNDNYLKGTTPRTVETECGITNLPSGVYKCRAFKSDSGTLCNVFNDYFNTAGTVNCAATSSTPQNGTNPAMKLTNGMEIYFKNQVAAGILGDANGVVKDPEKNGYEVWVDINGHGEGEDKKYYDVMPFYITLSGKVVPGVGTISPAIRGYEFDGLDAGGNSSLMAFDIVKVADDDKLEVLARSLSFREAACRAGYIADGTNICKYDIDNETPIDLDCLNERCDIRLVKKLKRVK
ncbi:MAG: prepilin-type N-terminal cleavage/methylation domain-containing protein [Fusobacterium sp.]|nr:prepilin-type N-terminal cleavage/methylation domain-containing protein [Fusobacterium sp.]